MANVLLIEDDDLTAREIAFGLARHGHNVERAATGPGALELAALRKYDVLVVDRMLPGLDGLAVIAALRNSGEDAPALILSALSDLDERVRGLREGGDDYLPKPFAIIELAARLEALLRRSVVARETILSVGSLRLDMLQRRAWRRGCDLELLPRELQLLEYLVRRVGQVVTRSMLLQDVWGYRFEPRSNVVDVHMGKLRRKVDAPPYPAIIAGVRGIGYRLDADS